MLGSQIDPIKIQLGVDGEQINLFTGFANRPTVSILNSQFQVEAYDAVAYFASVTSQHSPIVDAPLNEIIAELLLEAGFGSDQFILEPSLQPAIGYVAPNDKKVADLLTELCESEQYIIFADEDGIIHGWNALHFSASQKTPVWDFTLNNSKDMSWETTQILNDVIVDAKPYQTVPLSRIFYTTEASDDTLVPANGSKDIFIDFKDADDNTIYAIDIDPLVYKGAGTSSYTTNTAEDGTGSDNDGAVTLTSSYNFGDTMKLTFRNSSNIPTYITSISIYATSAQQRNYISLEAKDNESITDYGVNPDASTPGQVYKMESAYIQSAEFATAVATRLVETYAQPYLQINLDNFIVPQLQFGDAINISTAMNDGEQRYIVYGLDMSGGQNTQFSQKLSTEQRSVKNYFILDTSALDGGDILAV